MKTSTQPSQKLSSTPTESLVRNPLADRRTIFSLLIVASLIAVSRWNFLASDYGIDTDGWAIARVARKIAEGEPYSASRLPGYPFQEYAYSFLIRVWNDAGPRAFGAITSLFSILGCVAFGVLLKGLGFRHYALGALALASIPGVFINSTNAMDYVWALAFTISAYAAAVHSKPRWAGILVGLAIGCRITSGAALIPLSLLLPRSPARTQSLRVMWGFGLLVGGLCFIPVLATYGTRFMTFQGGEKRTLYQPLLGQAWTLIWGPLGLFILGAAAFFALLQRLWFKLEVQSNPIDQRRRTVAASLTGIALWTSAFLILPADPDYMLPTVPFVLLLLAHYLSQTQFAIACLALCLTPWIGVRSNKLTAGPVLRVLEQREQLQSLSERIIAEANALPDARALVFVGPLDGRLEVLREWSGIRDRKSLVFRRRPKRSVINKALAGGYSLYAVRVPDQDSDDTDLEGNHGGVDQSVIVPLDQWFQESGQDYDLR